MWARGLKVDLLPAPANDHRFMPVDGGLTLHLPFRTLQRDHVDNVFVMKLSFGNILIINVLHTSSRGGVYPHPRSNEQELM